MDGHVFYQTPNGITMMTCNTFNTSNPIFLYQMFANIDNLFLR